MCIYSHRAADTILFYHQGGVDIGDVDAKAVKLDVPVNSTLSLADVKSKLLKEVKDAGTKERIAKFISALYTTFVDLYFTYLEINPLVVTADSLYILDLAAKLDSTADFICRPKWGEIDYPPPFGRDAYPEEAYIADLDAKSGASLKLTILNRNGRIWTMVAGGGASVIYSDTICDLGGASELANYGEYSGAPSEQQTYEYAKTILNLMTSSPKHPDGKVLITGGGIANFTNVAATFQGECRLLSYLGLRSKCHLLCRHHHRPARVPAQAGRAQRIDLRAPCRTQLPGGSSANARLWRHPGHSAARLRSRNAHDRHLRHGSGQATHSPDGQRGVLHGQLPAARRTAGAGGSQGGQRSRRGPGRSRR